jgi:uncharacterized protein (TIGR00255 family)
MTGYARIQDTFEDFGYSLELKSVNHRYRELHLQLPPQLGELEQIARRKLESKIARGKLYFSLKGALSSRCVSYGINMEQVERYSGAVKELQDHCGLDVNLSGRDLILMPGVLQEKDDHSWIKDYIPIFEQSMDVLLDSFLESRKKEGDFLVAELCQYLNKMASFVVEIAERAANIPVEAMEKLRSKISHYHTGELDESRLHMEAAFIIEKADIEEEIVRLKSHLKSAVELLESKDDTGKKMNFLCQEMHREINTIGSKSSVLEIIERVLEFKTILEKTREQVQNLE